MLTQLHRGQDGSMPLVILASIVVLGMVTVMFTSVLTSQRVTRFDQNFTTAYHGADAGLQSALAQIRTADPHGTLPSDASTPTFTGSDVTGDVEYDFEATKVAGEWQIRAKGESNDTTRHVEATLTRPSRFDMAAFGKTLVGMKGANGAASYDGSGGSAGVDTGRGSVGSNGDIEIIGGGYADFLYLYGPSAKCAKTPENCAAMIDKTEQSPEPKVPATDFIEEVFDAAWCTASIDVYRASVDGDLVGGGGDGPNGEYCFASMVFDTDTNPDVSADPVVAYVSGDVSSSNSTIINCVGCASMSTEEDMLASNPPVAANLQINSVGNAVRIGNHNHFAAAIYAPNASCRGNPSVSQTTIYGSIVCGDINNQGGWKFWYDERLSEISGGEWQVSGVREEGESTSSF